jgi:hypothetical protein
LFSEKQPALRRLLFAFRRLCIKRHKRLSLRRHFFAKNRTAAAASNTNAAINTIIIIDILNPPQDKSGIF